MSTPLQTSSDPLLHEENARLQRAVHELSVLNDLALAIGGIQNSQDIIQIIIHRSLRAVGAAQGVITLVENNDNASMHTLVRTRDGRDSGALFHLDRQLLGWMQLHKQALAIDSPEKDERFRGIQWDQSIRSVLCVPLMVKSSVHGVLTLYNKTGADTFTPEDRRLLSIIASQSAQILENARLLESEKALQKMQEELRVAAQIQQNLLPQSPPHIEGYQITGISIPAQTVGGDYFDYFHVGQDSLGLVLADVSGKGLPASLLMANVQATLRGQAFWIESAAACVERANRLLYLSTASDRFVTLFFGLLDTRAHTLRYCNAGQEAPIVMDRHGAWQRLSTGGPLLGVVEDARFEEATIPFNPDDLMLVYSDGISEAMNCDGVMYGEERIFSVLHGHSADDAQTVVDELLRSTATHTAGAPQSDDRTVLAVRRRTHTP